ncbi:acyl-CoA dehydrogenase family protein [Nocardia carnea]|uniref:acyl-CoA dehydrogenase family protein n=1 Tax=Nocardia carnea TaxID=37328 RepID=UPI0024588DE1|nr:acyl-CoA dehydrogenase family protein [Nocardia carnea]
MTEAVSIATDLLPILKRHAAQVDTDAAFPHESVTALRDAGLFALLVPVEYGGMGGDLGELVDTALVLADGCLSTAMIWAMHCQQVDTIVRHANPRLRKDLLERVAAEGYYLGSVTTEPGKGAHLLSAHSAMATEDGRQLAVQRSAPVVTGGEFADGFLVTMRASTDAPSNRVSLVYLDRNQIDAKTMGGWNAMGMRATRSIPMFLSGTVPAHQLVGTPGDFRTIAVDSMVPAGHLAWSACWLGAARSALNSLTALIRSVDRPRSIIVDSELVRHRLARSRIELELGGSYLTHIRDEVLHRRRTSQPIDEYAFQIKLDTLKVTCSELSFSSVDRMIQLSGVMTGYQRDAPIPLERHFRDLRSASLNYSNDRLLTSIGALTILDGAGLYAPKKY